MIKSILVIIATSFISITCFAMNPFGENFDKFFDKPASTPATSFIEMCESLETSVDKAALAQDGSEKSTKDKLRDLEDLLIVQYDSICEPAISDFKSKKSECQSLYYDNPKPKINILDVTIEEYTAAHNSYYGIFVNAGCHSMHIDRQ